MSLERLKKFISSIRFKLTALNFILMVFVTFSVLFLTNILVTSYYDSRQQEQEILIKELSTFKGPRERLLQQNGEKIRELLRGEVRGTELETILSEGELQKQLEGERRAILEQEFNRIKQRDLRQLRQLSLLIFAGFAFFSLILSYLITDRLLSPLVKLRNSMSLITLNNLSKKIKYPVNPNDEIGQLVREFNQLIFKLHVGFKEQENYNAYISHELRTPLTSLSLQLQSLQIKIQQKGYDEEVLRTVAKSIDKTNELSNLIQMVTEITELKKKSNNNFQYVNFYNEMESFVHSYNSDLKVKRPNNFIDSVLLNLVIEEEFKDIKIKTNMPAIKILLKNLIDNAMSHSKTKENVELRVSKKSKNEKSYINIKVIDYGIGMPKDIIKRINSLVNNKNNAIITPKIAENGVNYGIGLYISTLVAKKLNTRIRIKSVSMKGTTISFNIYI